ncbi:hypothetical protein ACFLR4_03465 [Bacteroidota bacterium]
MEQLTFKKIFRFWYPLAATWLMMSIEGPFLTAVIARMIEPKFNLAAYGVAFSFALIIEAPIIMIMSASTAMVKGQESFRKLRNFTYAINGLITVIMLLFLIPSVFDFLAMDLIGLPTNIADLTYKATFLLLPWPGAIGYRRFYQGILIRSNKTRRVAYGTIVRVVTMAVTAFLLFKLSDLNGAIVGAAALSVGVSFEAIATKLMCLDIVKEVKTTAEDSDRSGLKYFEILKFYYPLALTSMIGLGVHPIVTFFMGQSIKAIESLAVLPVINSLVFIFRSLGLSFQEVGIAMIGDKLENYIPLKRFAFITGIISVGALAVIALTPLADIWFSYVSGLSAALTEFSILPLIILTILPGLTFWISFQRAMLVNAKLTQPISKATAIEVAGIILILLIATNYFNWVGAVSAAVGFVVGRLAANIYLIKPYNHSVANISS